MSNIRLKCSHCGGPKFVGDQYYSGGEYYVDVTCVICSHTKDIRVVDLQKFLSKLSVHRGQDVKKQTDNQ